MLPSHPGSNSEVDSNPNSHKMLESRKSNPLPGRGRNAELISSVVLVSPCPGSIQAEGWSCRETFQPPALCPAPLPKFGRRGGVSEPQLLQLTGCRVGRAPKANLPSLPAGKAPKGDSRCLLWCFFRMALCMCVCTFALLFVNGNTSTLRNAEGVSLMQAFSWCC